MKNSDSNIPGPLWRPYADLFKPIAVSAKTMLLREGEVSRKAYYIEKGCIRSWFNKEGRDITFQFFFEGRAVSSVESYRGNVPGFFNIETIETSLLNVLSKKDFDFILKDSKPIREFIEQNTFKRMIHYQKLFLSFIKDSPQERYEALLKEHPQILQRVPQYYIASYLGISAVHLSRIRSRVLRNKQG